MRETFSRRDIELGANEVILALDGKISRDDAKRVARAVLQGFGLTFKAER